MKSLESNLKLPENAAEGFKYSLDIIVADIRVDIRDVDTMVLRGFVSKLSDEVLRCDLANVAQTADL